MDTDLRLYFLRHGLADREDYQGHDDNLRPLTREGDLRMRRQADYLAGMHLDLDLILTSPLARAQQTAAIVASRLGLNDQLHEDDRLRPGFNREALAEILASLPVDHRHIMLVGHEPDFSTLIGEITGGSQVLCKKGSLARVDLEAGREPLGRLVWLLQPRAMLG